MTIERTGVEMILAFNQIEMTETSWTIDVFQFHMWELKIKGKDENLEKVFFCASISTVSDRSVHEINCAGLGVPG